MVSEYDLAPLLAEMPLTLNDMFAKCWATVIFLSEWKDVPLWPTEVFNCCCIACSAFTNNYGIPQGPSRPTSTLRHVIIWIAHLNSTGKQLITALSDCLEPYRRKWTHSDIIAQICRPEIGRYYIQPNIVAAPQVMYSASYRSPKAYTDKI